MRAALALAVATLALAGCTGGPPPSSGTVATTTLPLATPPTETTPAPITTTITTTPTPPTAPQEPPSFRIANLTLPGRALVGEPVNASADATNEGTADAIVGVTLLVNGATRDHREVPLTAGGTAPVSFELTPVVAGTFNVTIRLATGDAVSGTLVVDAQPAPTSFAVAISGFAFDPPTLRVPAGSTVTWTNADSVGHTATATGGAFDSGRLGEGAGYSFVFAAPGTFEYKCSIHSSMKGTIVVS